MKIDCQILVNGKPAIEWVMERQSVKQRHKQRHHQRRQPLGHRNHERPRLPPQPPPLRYHRQAGDDEDCGGAAEAGDLR